MDTTAPNELTELRARQARLEAERAEREAAAEAEDEIITARRAVRDAEALNAAIAEHGRVGVAIDVVETTLGSVIIKRATAARFQRFQDRGEFTTKDVYQLVSPSVIYPDKERFSAMLDEQPALLLRLSDRIARLAGVRRDELEKK